MILFTTTVNESLYRVSGKTLISTFTKYVPWGTLLISYEDSIDLPKQNNLVYYNLSEDSFLNTWLEKNKDIIPTKFGGDVDIEDPIFTKTKQHGFRRRAATWFRKIANLKYSVNFARSNNYEVLVGLDCDIFFKQNFPQNIIPNLIEGFSILGYMGKKRKALNKGLECGLVGFNLLEQGGEFIDTVSDVFQSGEFRNYLRWDDSYLYSKLIEEYRFSFKDLAAHVNDTKVMKYGILSSYLTHDKGRHNSLFK